MFANAEAIRRERDAALEAIQSRISRLRDELNDKYVLRRDLHDHLGRIDGAIDAVMEEVRRAETRQNTQFNELKKILTDWRNGKSPQP